MDYLQLQAKTLFNLPYRTNAIILLLFPDSSVSYDKDFHAIHSSLDTLVMDKN